MFQSTPLARFSVVVSCLAACVGCTAPNSGPADAPKLTLDRLYSLPHLIGTAPTGFVWSSDSDRVAFLWNQDGFHQRDVWVVDAPEPGAETAPTPERWTTVRSWADPDGEASPSEQTKVDQPYLDADALDRAQQDPGITAVSWHPDGEHIAASRAGDIWLVKTGSAPRRWLSDARTLRFAPDGRHAAFLRGGEIWVQPLPDGSARRLTDLTTDAVRISGFRWSPDGGQIALQETDSTEVAVRGIPDYLTEETTLREVRRAYPGEPAPKHRIGVLPLTGGRPNWIDPGADRPDMILDFRWSPDGRAIALDTSDHFAKDRRILVADLDADGRPRTTARMLAQDADPLNETFYFWRIAWSSDSQKLYFLSDREQDFHLWSVPATGGEPTQHTSGAWAVAEMVPRQGGVIVTANRGNAEERHVLWIEDGPASAEPVRLSLRPGTHTPVVSPDGAWAAVAHSSDDQPPEALLTRTLPADARAELEITDSPVDEFDDYRWVTPEYVQFTSHVDGTTLHGRLTLPPDFDPNRTYPAILGSVYTDSVRNQWGGRTAHPTWGLDQYLAQEGYVLLNVDMRGSWGRGREHRRGIRLDYGGMDIEDLESGVRFLGTLGYVDLDRVGIWGSSYGGLMTAMSLFRKPGLYAAGIAGAPATNVRHALTGQMAVMMRPQDQAAEYDDSSPVLHAHGLEDPLMIVHGMRDRVVLYKDSVELVHRLIQLDKDVDLLTLPNAGHGWDNEGLAQTRFAFRKMVDYFDRHVKGNG